MSWAPLLPPAMVGTERHAAPLTIWPGEMGSLIAQAAAQAEHPATALLRAAAVLATCERAGAQPPAWPDPLPSPAAAETWAEPESRAVHDALSQALQHGPLRLQVQACLALAQAERRLPTRLLPLALQAGKQTAVLRPWLLPVLGERGRWLAGQRDDWQYACGASAEAPADQVWQEGSLEQRRALLALERSAIPAKARERLAATLPELPAKERAELTALLATGLSADDEPLLETLRHDRSREVRQVALQLLVRLPDAAFTQRACQRMAGLLQLERGLLRKRWVIAPPTALPPDWPADQIELDRPKQESLGERAWWLTQLARQVPPAWWSEHTGMTATELLDWAQRGDWAEALLRAWRALLDAAPPPAWCDAWLDGWPKAIPDDSARVLLLLPAAQRERHLHGLLARSTGPLVNALHQLLGACPLEQTWSAPLSRTVAGLVAQQMTDGLRGSDYGLRSLLPEVACALHPDALPRLLVRPGGSEDSPLMTDLLRTLERVAATRQTLLSLTPARPT